MAPASYRRRAVAFGADLIVGFLPFWLLLPLIVVLFTRPGASDHLAASALLLIAPFPSVLLYFAIQVVQLSRGRQTPGRRIAGVEVVRADDQRPTNFAVAARRQVLGAFLPLSLIAASGLLPLLLLPLLWALIDPDKRSLPDRIAGTKIVLADPEKRERRMPWEPPLSPGS